MAEAGGGVMDDNQRARAIEIAANNIEKLAFGLAAPNSTTPRLVQEAQRLRAVASDIRVASIRGVERKRRGEGKTAKQLSALVEKVRAGEQCLFIVQSNVMRDHVWRLLLEHVAPEAKAALDALERKNYSFSLPGCDGRLSIQTLDVQPDRWRGVRLHDIDIDHSLSPTYEQAERLDLLRRICIREAG